MLTKLIQHNGEKNKIEETAIGHSLLYKISGFITKTNSLQFILSLKITLNLQIRSCHLPINWMGCTDEWQNIGSLNYIQFAGLPAGNYTLSIKGMGSNGTWGKELQHSYKS